MSLSCYEMHLERVSKTICFLALSLAALLTPLTVCRNQVVKTLFSVALTGSYWPFEPCSKYPMLYSCTATSLMAFSLKAIPSFLCQLHLQPHQEIHFGYIIEAAI